MKLLALDWIIKYLENHNTPYVVCGGLAAQAYGATCDLADIDIYVPDGYFAEVVEMGKEYISFGPAHHIGEQWSLTYVQFEFDHQKVDVGNAKNCKIYDAINGYWYEKVINFNDYEYREIYGRCIRVMNKNDLINYKKKLNRAVDIEDIQQIQ